VARRIAILGSTGSIGCQTLEVARELQSEIDVVALTANNSCGLLFRQARDFGVKHIGLGNECKIAAGDLPADAKLYRGIDGLSEIVSLANVDMVVFALFGAMGLKPLVAAIEAGKDIAFATKEALVAGGSLVMQLVRDNGVNFLPIDSEHNSILRCLAGREINTIRRIIITASGGPFRGFTREQLKDVTLDQALKHPIWAMGRRITVNSATMMNKALEMVEAHHLFGLSNRRLDVRIHPQGIFHALIELADGTLLAHLGLADMKLPIRFCLTYPDVPDSRNAPIRLDELHSLTFEKPDEKVFTTLALGRAAVDEDWSFSVALNAVNEVLVESFLADKIPFIGIIERLERAADGFSKYKCRPHTIDEVIALDAEVRVSTARDYLSPHSSD